MDFIIDFFRSIDGWIYYTMLVVNIILIFAIIGYLGEKNNEQLTKLGMNTTNPNLKSGTMNLNPVHSSPTNNDATIPKVVATQVNNVQNPVVPIQGAVVSSASTSGPVSNPNANTNPVISPVITPTNNNTSAIPTVNQGTNPIIKSSDNTVVPSEKAPAVLVINSSDVNKDVK